MFPTMRKINAIIVHSTATPAGRDVTVDEIRAWHRARGFSDIGYHFIVYRDGSVMPGRPIARPGAHCLNHNANTIGVCYVGGVSADGLTPCDTRTAAQGIALRALLSTLVHVFNCKVFGHRDFARTDCPSFDARYEYSSL